MKHAILFLSLIVVTASPAFADQMNLGDLHKICSSPEKEDKAACAFYNLGVMEGAGIGSGVAQDKRHFCIPDGVAGSQLESAVKKAMNADLKAYPKDNDIPAVSFISAVIMHEFPCPK